LKSSKKNSVNSMEALKSKNFVDYLQMEWFLHLFYWIRYENDPESSRSNEEKLAEIKNKVKENLDYMANISDTFPKPNG